MNDILFNESGLDSLITRLENTKNMVIIFGKVKLKKL